MAENLRQIRIEWEKGLTHKCVINHEQTKGNVLVVLMDPMVKDRFVCHRYFTIGQGWNCSVDHRGIALDEVWQWLEHQSR